MPFVGYMVSMVVLLPGSSTTLQNLETGLTADDLVNVEKTFVMHLMEVDIFLPMFSLDEKLELTKMLQALGMTDAFTSGKADFSGIEGTRGLFVSEVCSMRYRVHRVFCDCLLGLLTFGIWPILDEPRGY